MLNLHNMVDNVSHEFKLPIATLKYGCNNLSKEYSSPTVDLLFRQINRLERLLQQLSPSAVDVDDNFTKTSFDNILKDLQLHYPNIAFDFDWNVDKTLRFSKTDIETLLLNLLENAVKYGGTQIECKVYQHGNSIHIEVSDNGTGIAKEQQKLVFKKFYRIIKNNIYTSNGLGIGLYQVQQIAEQLKGKITLTSEIKKGTSIKIILPYA